MKRYKRYITLILAGCAIFLLLLDTKTALMGSVAGIALCTNAVIPALFPFIFLCNYINGNMTGLRIPGFSFIGKRLHIPPGGESVIILGFLGGYPVGAQIITDMYSDKTISKRNASILLGYCNNAGPAFIFGVTSGLFFSPWIPWVLWALHILSAFITGILLPKPDNLGIYLPKGSEISLVSTLQKTLKICANICGWIVLFRILIAYAEKYYYAHGSFFPVMLSGILELSNGCMRLELISEESLRFILCSDFLAFGGLCVMLQTASVAKEMGLGLYIPGKIIQTAVNTLIAIPISNIIFKQPALSRSTIIPVIFLCAFTIAILVPSYRKKFWNSQRI